MIEKTLPLMALGMCVWLLTLACQPAQPFIETQATQIAIELAPTQTKVAALQALTISVPTTSFTEPTSTPMPDAELATLPPSDIFAQVSPAIVFIDTPAGTGSGVYIHDGYIVTNAHVVWPFDTVRVVFPDKTEYVDAPVVSWDLMVDIAVVGPLEADVTPMTLVDGEDLIIGSDVFLIGYPGESEQFPQPTISRGLISRLREWTAINLTYFQTDASVAGGQSGGVLVSQQGDVIGISTFSFADQAFALVSSAADIAPRVEKLIDGQDASQLGERLLSVNSEQREYEGTLNNIWDTQLFVLHETDGTEIDITVEGENDFLFYLIDSYGYYDYYTDDTLTGEETNTLTMFGDGPHFLLVGQASEDKGSYQINAS
ncbi:MAG: serine protease, partial [Chloroflexota bacterium]